MYGIQYAMTKIRSRNTFSIMPNRVCESKAVAYTKYQYPCVKLVWFSGSENGNIREFSDGFHSLLFGGGVTVDKRTDVNRGKSTM
jgi:hypothetical protein